MAARDWWMLGIGLGIGFFIFTAIGKEAVRTGIGVTRAEAERLLKKVRKRSVARANG